MKREKFIAKISQAFAVNPIVAILGPRQCGKTTVAKMFAASQPGFVHFDLEDPRDLARLDNPMLALENISGLIIIDEIQLRPDLFPVLRVLIDKKCDQQRYLILGSASRDLIQQSSETLAGRISHLELTPFTLAEAANANRLLVRGGFPKSFLAETEQNSADWRREYISSFLERDIPKLGFNIPSRTLRRFWVMLAHYHANIFNATEIGNSLGVSHTAIRHYLDILTGTFMVRNLQPWFANIKKRQVKSPKIYFRDTGILNSLIGVEDQNQLLTHPKLGAVWEGFALEEIIRFHAAVSEDCYYWRTHTGAELDLLIVTSQQRLGFEIKYTDSPTISKSMRIALEDLELSRLFIIVPGAQKYQLAENIHVIGIVTYIQG